MRMDAIVGWVRVHMQRSSADLLLPSWGEWLVDALRKWSRSHHNVDLTRIKMYAAKDKTLRPSKAAPFLNITRRDLLNIINSFGIRTESIAHHVASYDGIDRDPEAAGDPRRC